MRPNDTENKIYQDEFNFGTLKDLEEVIKKKWPRTPRKNIILELEYIRTEECPCHWKSSSGLTVLVVKRVVKER